MHATRLYYIKFDIFSLLDLLFVEVPQFGHPALAALPGG